MGDNILDFIPRPGVARFFREAQRKNVRYLISHYRASEEMAEEAFAEGCHKLLDAIQSGRLTAENVNTGTVSTLEAYLFKCCRTCLLKMIEADKRIVHEPEDPSDDGEIYSPVTGRCQSTDQHESDLELMKKIVLDLPSPCNDLIYGKYYNRQSLTELAEELNYSSPRVAITTLSRCIKKVRARFKKERTLAE